MKFKKLTILASAAALSVALLIPTVASAAPAGLPDDANRIYKFNIIGVDNVKDVDMTGDNGKRIFVPLHDKCKIMLTEGEWDILDANGTDGEAALQLPAPGYDPYIIGEETEVLSDYSIYIRSLGKPGGYATITTCAELVDSTFGGLLPNATINDITNKKSTIDPNAYCSIEQVGQDITLRTNGKDGKTTFQNVTAELTSIVFSVWIDADGDGEVDEGEMSMVRVPIFDEALENEFWEYDNNGLKLLQVWIYDNQTNVAANDGDLVPEPPVIS